MIQTTLISIVSALGTVIARTIIFFASFYGSKIRSNETKKEDASAAEACEQVYVWPREFVAAATPIPDDIVYIPLGLARYSPLEVCAATFAGRLVMKKVIVWGTVYFGRPIAQDVLSNSTDVTTLVIVTMASIAVMDVIIIIYFSLKMDWAKFLDRWFPWAVREEGDDKT